MAGPGNELKTGRTQQEQQKQQAPDASLRSGRDTDSIVRQERQQVDRQRQGDQLKNIVAGSAATQQQRQASTSAAGNPQQANQERSARRDRQQRPAQKTVGGETVHREMSDRLAFKAVGSNINTQQLQQQQESQNKDPHSAAATAIPEETLPGTATKDGIRDAI